MPHHPRSIASVASLLVLVVVLGACSGVDDDTADTAPSSESTTAPGEAPSAEGITWESCGDAECGRLTVPLDHDDPDGDTIELALARRPAGDPDARIGSLVVNPGGPGASGASFVTGGFSLGEEVDERFDVVGFDPRGVGESTPVDCGDAPDEFLDLDPQPDDDAELRELQAAAADVSDACAGTGALLEHLDTATVARDLDAIRAALGDEQLTYLGYSYGTLIGQLYAEQFPERVRALVLDGVVNPAEDLVELLTAQTDGFDRAFAALAASCDDDPGCAVDDVAGAYDGLAAEVEEEPLTTDGDDELGPSALSFAAVSAAYDSSTWPIFAQGLADGLDGDGTILLAFADAYRSAADYGVYAGVVCTDGPHPPDPAAWEAFAQQLEEQSPRFGAAVANELLPCATWPAPVVGQPAPVVAEGAAPILVVGTTGDPATPFANAEQVAATLADAVLLTHDGEGHTSGGEADCDHIVARYLIDLAIPDPGSRC
ncbi:alpha/beta hydrolase [soil metagenome]